MCPRIQGKKWRLRCCDDRPEDLLATTETSVEDDTLEDSDDGDRGVGGGRGNCDAPEGTSPTAVVV